MCKLLLLLPLILSAHSTIDAAELLQKKGRQLFVSLTPQEAKWADPGSRITLLDQGSEVSRGQITRKSKSGRKIEIQISGNPERFVIGNIYWLAALESDGSLRLWDGSDADVAWVNDSAEFKVPSDFNPLLTLTLGGGHRIYHQDDEILAKDKDDNLLSQGKFLDLIQPENSVELRSYLNFFKAFSLGVIYHVDDAKLKINEQSVPISLQELSASLLVGPRFGMARFYALYNQVINSKSLKRIRAPTLVSDPSRKQDYEVEVKQTGREIGLGMQLFWEHVGLFAEAVQSYDRSFTLSIGRKGESAGLLEGADDDSQFRATSKTSYQAWQMGLTLEF